MIEHQHSRDQGNAGSDDKGCTVLHKYEYCKSQQQEEHNTTKTEP